jgi:hypothetical protein
MGIIKTVLIFLFLFSSSCSLRVFKDKVPEPNNKTRDHKESEREGAYYLAEKVTEPSSRKVAQSLSNSLGIPSDTQKKSEEIASSLKAHSRNYEERGRELNEELSQYSGKRIEGTGLNIMPAITSISFIGFIVLLVLFPSVISVFFFLLRRSKLAFGNLVKGIGKFSQSEPEAGTKLNDILEKELDRKEKLLAKKFE